jgi:hypothetical protein
MRLALRLFLAACAIASILGLSTLTVAQNNPIVPTSSQFSCNTTPCVLPNTQASSATYSVFPSQMAVNPTNATQVMLGAWACQSVYGGIVSTTDGGSHWDDACLPLLPGTFGLNWTFVGYDLNGVAYAGASDQLQAGDSYESLTLSSSLDNGRTWSSPVSVFSGQNGLAWPQLAIDTNASSPLRNSLYISSVDAIRNIAISSSHDGGISWTTSYISIGNYPFEQVFPKIAIGNSGEIYATWLLCKPKPTGGGSYGCGGSAAKLMFAKSSDGGVSFSQPAEIASPRLAPGAENSWGALPGTTLDVSNFPVIAVDTSAQPTSGNLYVSFYNYNTNQLQVGVITSRDGGSTWSAAVNVSSSLHGDQFSQWIAVSPSGIVGVTWLDRRLVPSHFQPYFSYSMDGGATFIGERPLTSQLSVIKSGRLNLWHDFRMHVWAGNTLYANWMDTRTGNYQLEVGGVQF